MCVQQSLWAKSSSKHSVGSQHKLLMTMSGTRGLRDITQTAANMVLVTMRPSAVLGSCILGASAWCRSDCETETVAQPAWSSFWTLTGPSLTKSTPQELKPATEATNPKIWLRWGSDEKSVHPIRNNLAASHNQRSCPLLAIKNNTAIVCTFSDLCVISIFPIQSIKHELRHTGIICHFHYKYPSTASIWQKNKKTKQNNNKNLSSKQPKQHCFSLFSTAATPNVVWVWFRVLLMTGAGPKSPRHVVFNQLGGDQVTEGHVTWLTSTFVPIVFVSSRLLLLFSVQPDGEYAGLKMETLHRMTGCHVFLLWWCFFFFGIARVVDVCWPLCRLILGAAKNNYSLCLLFTSGTVAKTLPASIQQSHCGSPAAHAAAAACCRKPPDATDWWLSLKTILCLCRWRALARTKKRMGRKEEGGKQGKKIGRGKRLRGWILGGQGWEEKNKRRRKGVLWQEVKEAWWWWWRRGKEKAGWRQDRTNKEEGHEEEVV